jgi:UDP-N-acetylglucosamine 4,6-dehydratase/5-epimerase
MFNNHIILCTGGSGSWGNELTKQLLENWKPKEIRIFSRGETNQVAMKRKFNNPKLTFIIGDVRDEEAITRACKGVDFIFHLAAQKHLPISEELPLEAIKTNIIGTENVIKAALANNIEKVILSNTDKACSPSSVYGCTKMLAERLFLNANTLGKTKFVSVKAGNVMGSAGSAIPMFINLLKEGKDIPITDFRMTRYFITTSQAVSLLLKAAEKAHGGEIFILNMNSCYITDLVKVLQSHYRKNMYSCELKEIGSFSGEKLDEMLISKQESPHAHKLDDNYFIILPNNDINNVSKYYKNLKRVDFEEFTSKTKTMNFAEIKDMLDKGGFLE